MIMFKKLILVIALFLLVSSPVFATLGNDMAQNDLVYDLPKKINDYNLAGTKNIVVYEKDSFLVTVVYNEEVSILENITYVKPIEDSSAVLDIKTFILPTDNQKSQFQSVVNLESGYYVENIYDNGIKIKTIYNNSNKVIEVFSSVAKMKDALNIK